MTELREKIVAIVRELAVSAQAYGLWSDGEDEAGETTDAILALIQKEQVWRDISSAPKDGRLMLLELDDGSIKLGRYHKSPTYSFLWWSEDAAPLSEPRRWCPTPPQGEDG